MKVAKIRPQNTYEMCVNKTFD